MRSAQWFRAFVPMFIALTVPATVALAHDPELHAMQARPKFWSKQAEARFLENLMDHHAKTARMAKLTRKRSAHAELRAWGDTAAVAHAGEVKRIDGLLRAGYERVHVPPTVGAAEPLEKLKGAAFDQEFLRAMIQSHGAALAEANECSSLAANPKLTQLCGGLVDSQQLEVAMMGSWLCKWYQKCE